MTKKLILIKLMKLAPKVVEGVDKLKKWSESI
jgi:hypothetical protein